MANWVIVVDGTEARRRKYAEAVRGEVALLPGLKVGGVGSGPVRVEWAAGERAPVDSVSDGAGGAVVWGEAIAGPSDVRASAEEIRRAWSEPGRAATWDGFYSAVRWDSEGGVTVGADVLGVFPIYWWSDGEVLLVGTSPELFGRHPSFQARLDPLGLVGILLTNGLVGGRTLWSGVRRLGAGRVLRGRRVAEVQEEVQYEIPLSERFADLPFRGQVDVLGEALKEAVARHAPSGQAYGMLLSGGLDSRMLAGFLHEQGTTPETLTLGRDRDFEMTCAKRVASFLGSPQSIRQIEAGRYPELAERMAHWEHLANGLNGIMDWGLPEILGSLPSRTVVGYMADGVVGGIHNSWAYDRKSRSHSLAKLLDYWSRWGLTREAVKLLLPDPVFQEGVEEVFATLDDTYVSSADKPLHRAWRFDLLHRQRLHVGGTMWPISFGAWPLMPAALDRQVIEVAAGLPGATLADRRAQQGLVVTRFPGLAALPLDRNSAHTLPLAPGLRDLLAEAFRVRAARVLPGGVAERRQFFFREYSFESPGWLAVRGLAEDSRADLERLFAPAALDRYWPRPKTHRPRSNPPHTSSGAKLLTGFALLARHHSLV